MAPEETQAVGQIVTAVLGLGHTWTLGFVDFATALYYLELTKGSRSNEVTCPELYNYQVAYPGSLCAFSAEIKRTWSLLVKFPK